MDVNSTGEAGSLADLLAVLDHLDSLFAPPLNAIRERLPEIQACDATGEFDPDDQSRAILGLCDELIGLTREFADYAGMAGGRLREVGVSMTLSSLVGVIDQRFAAQANSRGVKWTSRLVGEDITICCEVVHFRQVMAQVVAFALNATAPGDTVSFEMAREGSGWRWSVIGFGKGLADESIERAFLPLYRIDRDPDATCEAGGAGISICREIVEELGGSLEFGQNAEGARIITASFDHA